MGYKLKKARNALEYFLWYLKGFDCYDRFNEHLP